jgi:hypothetical protein
MPSSIRVNFVAPQVRHYVLCTSPTAGRVVRESGHIHIVHGKDGWSCHSRSIC